MRKRREEQEKKNKAAVKGKRIMVDPYGNRILVNAAPRSATTATRTGGGEKPITPPKPMPENLGYGFQPGGHAWEQMKRERCAEFKKKVYEQYKRVAKGGPAAVNAFYAQPEHRWAKAQIHADAADRRAEVEMKKQVKMAEMMLMAGAIPLGGSGGGGGVSASYGGAGGDHMGQARGGAEDLPNDHARGGGPFVAPDAERMPYPYPQPQPKSPPLNLPMEFGEEYNEYMRWR